MSSQELQEYVKNPYTGRLIKKGSKTYKKLLSAQLLKEDYVQKPDNTIMETESSSDAQHMQMKINKAAVGKNKVVTRRGTKVLTAQRRPKQSEVIDRVSDLAMQSVLEQKEHILEQNMTDAELDEYIKHIIQKKLVGQETTVTRQPSCRPAKKITTRGAMLPEKARSKYRVREPPQQVPEESEDEYIDIPQESDQYDLSD